METFQPIYPLTTGLSNKTVQKAQVAAFEMYREEEYLPESVRKYYDLEPVDKAAERSPFSYRNRKSNGGRRKELFLMNSFAFLVR